MSLSASDSNGSFSRVASGKTPPPAPSAAFAKRAREIEAEERLGARYRPPALRALASGGSPPNDSPSTITPGDTSTLPPPTTYPAGFRRARAGTLPSNVQLAAQRFAAASSNLGSTPASTESFSDQLQRQTITTPSATPAAAPVRPGLRHSASIASSVASSALTERQSRLRSGSLTLPTGNLSNAFGSSIFSSSWLSRNDGGAGLPVLDDLRSVTSMDSGADDFDVHTLDYLGLDETLRHPPAATITELRNQAQAAIAGNLASHPSRLRAITVSTPYHVRSSASNPLLSTPTAQEEEEFYDEDMYHSQGLDSYDDNESNDFLSSNYVAKGFKHGDHLTLPGLGSRPRAISVGNLDDTSRSLHRRAAAAEAQQASYATDLSLQTALGSGSLSPASILRSDKLTGIRNGGSPTVHFPVGELPRSSSYLAAPSTSQNRAVSPKSESSSTQMQTPTRSLWIGNLDSSVTSEQLIHVFAPYGAIESLRLLPEKECGFVNFVDQADAVRAKEDVLNRLGGDIGMPNGQTVRIGFGKADSAPVAPAKGTTLNSPSATSPGGVLGKSTGNNSGLAGMDAQLQSTPTRALWIGSIPSTTTPATILSVFSPYGPIESARVLTHKNCGFINFERLDDAVRARKALNGRDVLGSDVGAIRIGFAKVPVKNGQESNGAQDDSVGLNVQGIGDLSVGATIHALRNIKGASTIPVDQQVLSGAVENYRSNLLLSMISSGAHSPYDGVGKPAGWTASVTEQQMIMKELSGGSPDADADIQALAEFRPPTMYYTTIPLVSERPHNRRWDASKLRELRKRLDTSTISTEEIDNVAADFLDGEIVDLASDWLGNTVVQKLFEKCSAGPRLAMLERISPHLAMIGIHKNGTWAAQKIIECVQTPDEVAIITQNLRPYVPPLLLDQFGNYVVQCCLRFGAPATDFLFDAMVDRLWEIAQGRFGARSMRACLESTNITLSQQRRIATAIILNSIPLATNPNGALLLTWLLDTSSFPSRYNLLAPRFTPHLSHLCTHKLASLTVLRIVNQKVEPEASSQIVEALFSSPGDHVLTDVLGDQVNGVAVVHKILTSPFVDPALRPTYVDATKRVLIELKVIATQAYRRLIEEVGLPVPNLQPTYSTNVPQPSKTKYTAQSNYTMPGLPAGYPSNDQGLASMMAALQMGGQNAASGPPRLQIDPGYGQVPQNGTGRGRASNPPSAFSPSTDPFNPFRSPDVNTQRNGVPRRNGGMPSAAGGTSSIPFGAQSPSLTQAANLMGMTPPPYASMSPQSVPPHVYQAYMYQMYQQQNTPNMGTFHA
ncbi:hypothetical protein BKA93DRAFT_814965 [Sparassis latifolia]|uniref:Pumilio domain-containing protein n=1 Tax=Sparassis crispa TaxID=139825 RepID=A0A401GJP8_9APHY|nr:hypothetical protein SCP_0407810 [Sparassis crispa]GBE82397.1 hypothetical protein SCP_0407810 [Sparassis crispa]